MRPFDLLAGILFLTGSTAVAAQAAENAVHVDLQDTSIDGALLGMHMRLDRTDIKAGPVTFRVTNQSKALVHEMLVLRTKLAGPQLPYDPSQEKFDEAKLKSLGEVSDLPPGKSGQLTLDLKPGSYLLTCNQPGHLHAGMWARLTVAP